MPEPGRGVLHLLFAGCLLLAAPGRVAGAGAFEPGAALRGVVVLSSSVGGSVPVDELVGFVEACGLDVVVVDYCWVTSHWPRTDHEQVRRLVQRLGARGVEVAAMYRPRGMNPSEADVHWARLADGTIPEHHNSLCFAHEDSAAWGMSWGTRILDAQPGIRRIILYNLGAVCRCDECLGEQGRAHIGRFLDRCRRVWRRARSDIEIGHVGRGAEYAESLDFLCPFFSVNRDLEGGLDLIAALERAREPRTRYRDLPVVPLLKACWSGGTRNTSEDVAEAIRLATRTGTGFLLWYYEWLFGATDDRYDRNVLLSALAETPPAAAAPARRNPARAWAFAPSRESGEEHVPGLVLTVHGATRHVPVAQDAFVASYLPDTTLGAVPRVTMQAGGATQVLLSFRLPRGERDAAPDRAELVLPVVNGTEPLVAPVRIAVHAVSGPWEERTVTWRTRPSFSAEPLRVVEMDVPPCTLRIDVTDLVRAWIDGSRPDHGLLLGVVPAPGEEDPRIDDPALVAVKDFLRIENPGDTLPNVEFPRYLARIDEEQVVLARWVTARTDAGTRVGIGTAAATPDPAGNFIQRYRIASLPERTGVVVTITSLVLRRERPPPLGEFPIRSPDEYPAEVRPWLQETLLAAIAHPEVRAVARELESRTGDALETAKQLAILMRGKSYRQQPNVDSSLPVAARVLKHGGSCCGSAVAAAAVLRARGIPTQITYCPAGYVHGIVRFYLSGYGWCRMDPTCGTGRMPLVEQRAHRGLVRLFDMPVEMERIANAYAWPYHSSTQEGAYVVLSDGQPAPGVRLVPRPPGKASRAGSDAIPGAGPLAYVDRGSWNLVLEFWAPPSARDWERLAEASRKAVRAREEGVFDGVTEPLGEWFAEPRRTALLEWLREYGPLGD